MLRSRVAWTLLCLSALALPGPAQSQTVAEFYAAHPITIYIASDAGGGYDTYTRALAKYLTIHLPGHPKITTEAMPGASGITAVNVIANKAPRDGTVIGAIRAASLVEPLVQQGSNVAQYDPHELTWIGNISKQQAACFTWHTSPIKTIEQAKTREVAVGSTGALSNIGTFPSIVNELIGTKFKVVEVKNLKAALEGGTIEGICGMSYSTANSTAPEWIKDQKLNFLAQSGMERSSQLSEVPLVSEFARSSADRDVFQLLAYRELMGRPFVAPPGVPADRVAALRAAFDDTMKDPAFRTEATSLHLDVDPTDYKGIEAMIASAYAMPPDVIKRVWGLMHASDQHGAAK